LAGALSFVGTGGRGRSIYFTAALSFTGSAIQQFIAGGVRIVGRLTSAVGKKRHTATSGPQEHSKAEGAGGLSHAEGADGHSSVLK
jgi:hypothetical protein